MLGARAREELERVGHDVVGVVRSAADPGDLAVDLSDRDQVWKLLDERWDCVVNCAGIVKGREDRAVETVLVNAALPHWLAEGARLVHVSTDCVFDGKQGPYLPSDDPTPVDLYGATKLAGEAAWAVVVRTSFVGWDPAERRGLLEWLRGATGAVRGYPRALWSGLSAREAARALALVVGSMATRGLYHLGGETVSKADLLRRLASANDWAIDVVDDDSVVIDRSLESIGFSSAFGYRAPPWSEMAAEIARERT
jgi:dTDP-4-dehydrorhamnose reductase